MTNAKTTKRALLSSIVALLICFTMLLGTTFAWFTDSVSSTNNIIKSGTLDVEMTYSSDNATWADASTGTIFNYQLWEPGYSEMKYVKIENKGDLAFKYQLNIIPNILNAKEVYGVDLADVIDVYFGLIDENHTVPTSFADVKNTLTRVGTLSSLMLETDGAAHGILLPEGSTPLLPEVEEVGSVTACIVLHMQETAGNEYQNLSVGEGFSVQLLATQYTYEEDSFDNQYDAEADYDTNQAIPVAKVEYADEYMGENPTTPIVWNNSWGMVRSGTGDVDGDGKTGENDPDEYDIAFDAAYVFTAPVDADTAEKSPYKYYIADFAVSFDKDVTSDMQIGIAGNYGAWNWIGFMANNDLLSTLEGNKIAAGDVYNLLEVYSGGVLSINYYELCNSVKEFKCSAWGGEAAKGVTLTVELRLYETYSAEECYEKFDYSSTNEKTGNYYVIGTYNYTFTGE